MYIVLVVVVASISTHCSMYLELTLGSTKEMEQLQSKVVQQKALVHQGCEVCVSELFFLSFLLPLAGQLGN
jgi:hypothetical protein